MTIIIIMLKLSKAVLKEKGEEIGSENDEEGDEFVFFFYVKR